MTDVNELVIRKHYGPALRVDMTFKKPSRTKQSFQDECNINKIMAKYEKTGLINHLNRFQGDYGDYLDVQDYQTSCNQVLAAQEAFDSLPAAVRRRFENNPASFLEFVGNPENKDEMVKLGLLKAPRPEREPVEADGGAPEPVEGDGA